MAFKYTAKKKYQASFIPNQSHDTQRVKYWSRGCKGIYEREYRCDIRRVDRDDDCRERHHCRCRILKYYPDYVLVEDCHGRVYAIYLRDICSLKIHCHCKCDDDWNRYIYLFD